MALAYAVGVAVSNFVISWADLFCIGEFPRHPHPGVAGVGLSQTVETATIARITHESSTVSLLIKPEFRQVVEIS